MNTNFDLLREFKNKEKSENKLTLVLDLDETLIRCLCTSDIDIIAAHIQNPDLLLSYNYANVTYMIFKRPYLYEFLKDMSELFNLEIYTNSTKIYCETIMAMLIVNLQNNPFHKYTYRETNSNYLKKLETSQKNNSIIIDDRTDVWADDLDNLIMIKTFSSFSDDELVKLNIELKAFYEMYCNNNSIDMFTLISMTRFSFCGIRKFLPANNNYLCVQKNNYDSDEMSEEEIAEMIDELCEINRLKQKD